MILCERGIRTFETAYRNVLYLNAVSYLKKHTKYKVFVDPSHGTGKSELIEDLSLAALAVGADGLLIESHVNPLKSWSDEKQALSFDQLESLIEKIKALAPHFGKQLVF